MQVIDAASCRPINFFALMKSIAAFALASAVLGPDVLADALTRGCPFRVGVTTALPHDPDRLKKSQERQARRAARRADEARLREMRKIGAVVFSK